MKLRELQREFEKKGVKYTQIDKKVYPVEGKNGEEKKDGYFLYKCENVEQEYKYYELFRYRIAKPHPYDAGDWDMVEVYPGDEQFGLWAWCFSTQISVVKKMESEFGVDCDIRKLI